MLRTLGTTTRRVTGELEGGEGGVGRRKSEVLV